MRLPRPNRTTVFGLVLLFAVVAWRFNRRAVRRREARIAVLERKLFPEWFEDPWRQRFVRLQRERREKRERRGTGSAAALAAKYGQGQTKPTNFHQVFATPAPFLNQALCDFGAAFKCGFCGSRVDTELAHAEFSDSRRVYSFCCGCRRRWATELPTRFLTAKHPEELMLETLKRHAAKVAEPPDWVKRKPMAWNGETWVRG